MNKEQFPFSSFESERQLDVFHVGESFQLFPDISTRYLLPKYVEEGYPEIPRITRWFSLDIDSNLPSIEAAVAAWPDYRTIKQVYRPFAEDEKNLTTSEIEMSRDPDHPLLVAIETHPTSRRDRLKYRTPEERHESDTPEFPSELRIRIQANGQIFEAPWDQPALRNGGVIFYKSFRPLIGTSLDKDASPVPENLSRELALPANHKDLSTIKAAFVLAQ